MVEWVGLSFLQIICLIICRQVPGLRSRVSKRKRQTGPDVQTRTRQNPAERILAQRARRDAGNQEEDHRHDQQLRPGPVLQLQSARVDSNQHGNSQQPHLVPAQQADGGKDQAGPSHHHAAKPRSVPAERLETVVVGEGAVHAEGDNDGDELNIEEEQDHARRREIQKELRPSLTVQTNAPQAPVVQDSQPAPATKRQVGFAFSNCDFVLKLFLKAPGN